MDQDQTTPNIEESIAQMMQSLPPTVRAYLEQERYSSIARTLTTKYTLAGNQPVILEREMMLLLMGVENPGEFAAALKDEAMLSDDVVQNIMTDVNQEVFIPLQEEIKKEAEAMRLEQMKNEVMSVPIPTRSEETPVAPQKAEEVPLPQKAPEVVLPRWTYAPPPQSPSYLYPEPEKKKNLSGGSAQPASNTGRAVPSAPPEPAKDIMINTPFMAPKKNINLLARNGPTPVKPIAGEKLLEDHEESHIEFNKAPAPRIVPPPANLPGALPPMPTPVTQPAISKPVPPPIPTPPVSYSVDPYHEPIDENS